MTSVAVQKERLLSLLGFAKQSAVLRVKPVPDVFNHGLFRLFEHELVDLPGIKCNVSDAETGDEVWLAISRVATVTPPSVDGPLLHPWVRTSDDPAVVPDLLPSVIGRSLIVAGTHSAIDLPSVRGKQQIDPDATILLSDYDTSGRISAQFDIYLNSKWQAWAAGEKLRRKSGDLYNYLFTLKHQLEGAISETQLELVWGVGVGVWNCNGIRVCYPLVRCLVEISFASGTATLLVRPRDGDAQVEVDWYRSQNNPGVERFVKESADLLSSTTGTFSPFDKETFEAILRSATTNLDARGTYLPDVTPESRGLPPAGVTLTVSNTWVLFARARTNNLVVQDLEKLTKVVEDAAEFPAAVASVVSDPDDGSRIPELPLFRGLSALPPGTPEGGGKPVCDLFFPKPFNSEQVRIVQLLEVSDGVVVQGPPGTGKTHTIANIICHYLALGKRVLVTSMKDPALAVLQRQLPLEIQPLAIALLTSEQDGMKQFEHAILKIATEVQSFDIPSAEQAIVGLHASIDTLHSKLAKIDREIGEMAERSVSPITVGVESFDPQEAASLVVENIGTFEWISDAISVEDEYEPTFSVADVQLLSEARVFLGQDIDYLNASLPTLTEFPDASTILAVHRDSARFDILSQAVQAGAIPGLADASESVLHEARQVLVQISGLRGLQFGVWDQQYTWANSIHRHLRLGTLTGQLARLEALGSELGDAAKRVEGFLVQPIEAPEDIDLDVEIVRAVNRLANGRAAFGLQGILGKNAQKVRLNSIRVVGGAPDSAVIWGQVADYMALSKTLRQLSIRWNALAVDINIDQVPSNTTAGGKLACSMYGHYLDLKTLVAAEKKLTRATAGIFPNWSHRLTVVESTEKLLELETAIHHHLTRQQLAAQWAEKEKIRVVMVGRTGRITESFREFLAGSLGNSQIEDAQMQEKWSTLSTELARLLELAPHLDIVRRVCGMIEESGAPRYAATLRLWKKDPFDSVVPGDFLRAWKIRRLSTYLESIDAQRRGGLLSKKRLEVEAALARAYGDIVVKQTWLKLAENATAHVRAALRAYLTAIQRIGKGTGRRAVRFRHDARIAATQANSAVPCWIMPHYRVSESLPAELGVFDLVIIDEASQSDLTALPSLLRAKKVLIVGDDKQVSPDGVGLEESKVISLMSQFLANQVEIYGHQMSPDRSIYDLFNVVFARSGVMLKEHFRCVRPIIEYSKREFYDHELLPLRVPAKSERLDPPLIDVFVEDGNRQGDINGPEAKFIVGEIRRIVADPEMRHRSIGVVSLLADKQARLIWEELTNNPGTEVIRRHHITCGDARTFQGQERDIMFLSMISAPNDLGAPPSRAAFDQRYNVAASRARDRMYLVRSVQVNDLSEADKLRRKLIAHFSSPFGQDEGRAADMRSLCESDFERNVYDELTQRGYLVTPQVKAGAYRIDMVVEGHNDSRLAIECDGDRYHGADRWAGDMYRQRVLERAGWAFWRCYASEFIRRKSEMVADLLVTLAARGIEAIGASGARQSAHTELRIFNSAPASTQTGAVAPREDIRARGQATAPVVATAVKAPPPVGSGIPRRHLTGNGGQLPNLFSSLEPTSSAALLGQLDKLAREARVDLVDERAKGGKVWILLNMELEGIGPQLKLLGLKFKLGKGWFLPPEHPVFIAPAEFVEPLIDRRVASVSGLPLPLADKVLSQAQSLASKAGVQADDSRHNGGCLWVYFLSEDQGIAVALKDLGFIFTGGRGWWLK